MALMATSFEQFIAVLGNEAARRAIGIDISDHEALRIATDPVLARAYYDSWSRQPPIPLRPHSREAITGTPLRELPGHRKQSAPRVHAPAAAAFTPRHRKGMSIFGMVLSLSGYIMSGTWFSLIGVLGLVFSIAAIREAAEDKPRIGWKGGMAMGIIGTVAGASAVLFFIAGFFGYYD